MVRHLNKAMIAGIITLLLIALFSVFGPAFAAGPTGYTWVAQNPVGTGEQLYSTSALNATSAWSVGAYGAILYWNGTTLTKQASGTTNNLYGVYAQDATHVWAVGEKGTILFYNGTTWAPQGVGVTTYDLSSVSAAAANRVWAVGGYDGFHNAVILYYNGTTWTVQSSQPTGGFTDVYAYDATHVWAVNIWTWFFNGTSWSMVNDGSAHAPYQITGYSATNLWAIDWDGTILYSTNAGTTWNAAPDPPGGTSWPAGISALDATHIYIVGWEGNIAMYNGTAWATRNSGTTKDLYDVDIFNATSVFAGGDTKFIAYNTPTWNSLTGGTTSQLNAVHGRDADNVWTVGTNVATFGNIQRTTSGGNIWNTQASGTTNTLYGVDYLDATHLWTAGQNNIRFWNGGAWTSQVDGTVDTVGSTIAVQTQPRSGTVNEVTNRIYVVNTGSNSLSVIDGSTDTVITTVPVGSSPRGVCVNPVTNKVYVGNQAGNSVTVINGATNTVIGTVTVGTQPYRLSVNPNTNKIYVANYGSNNVSVINGATDTVSTTIALGTNRGPLATEVNTTTNRVYVANYTGNSAAIINGATDTLIKTINVGNTPYGVDVNETTNKIYVVNSGGNSVSMINGTTDTVGATINVGTTPRGVCVNPVTNRIYTANFDSNNISVINGATDTVAATLAGGTQPFGAGANSMTNKIYIANYGGNNVSVIYGPDGKYNCISAAAANRVWAGSDYGRVRYYNGTTWSMQVPDAQYSGSYYGVSAADTTHVWAVGATGQIAHWNGTVWAKQTSGTTNTLRAVTAINSTTAWASGDGGVICYTSNGGATWTVQTSGTTQNLLGISAADATHVWAVGMGGIIFFYDGTSWASQTSPTTNNLRAVFAYDANNAWAVGDNGTIIFADPPYIKACAPGWGSPGDTVDIEIIGGYTNFQASTPTLSLGAGVSVVPGTVSVIDNTHILAQVYIDPGAELGPRDVNATTTGETPIPLTGGFVVGATPSIASISRSTAPRSWTGDVEITGSQTSFSDASEVTFGSGVTVNEVTCRDIYNVTANITVDGSAAPGSRSVNITTGGETPAPLADAFTVTNPPIVADVWPVKGPEGSEVIITGASFGPTQGGSTITFNGMPATVAPGNWTDDGITTTVPAGATTGSVVVTTTEGASNNDRSFIVGVSNPAISSCSPALAQQGDTIDVEITGTDTNFLGGSSHAVFSNSGITVNSTTVTNAENVTANITIESGATLGATDVNVITNSETPAPLTGGFTIVKSGTPDPVIDSISPDSGLPGATVTVEGSNFGSSWAPDKVKKGDSDPYVSFNGMQASRYLEWTDDRIMAVVPDGASTGPVTVVTAQGRTSNGKTFTVTTSTFYFAEGYTGANFAEYLCLANPGSSDVTAYVTFLFSDGKTKRVSYEVPATGRVTIDVNSEVGIDKEVSMQVFSETADLVAERPMYFNYNGVWTGGSDAVGATAPNTDWYFAEGNTLSNFDEYITVLNPGDTVADLTFHYMVEGEGEKEAAGSVPAHSRATFKTREQIGDGKNASLHLESSKGVIAERPMYFNYKGAWTGGHDVVGANAPARAWYFAEGTTRGDFEEWLFIQNPGDSPITVEAVYMPGEGQGDPIVKSYNIPAKQRYTISVNNELGPDMDNSVKLTSSGEFIAERAMYFNYQGDWTGGHDVLGANSAAKVWYFAEGNTRTEFNEWFCLQNPGEDDAEVTMTYYTASGETVKKTRMVKAGSRLTVDVDTDVAADLDISVKVTSDNPIIVERPMYFNYNGWTGGHDVLGFTPVQ